MHVITHNIYFLLFIMPILNMPSTAIIVIIIVLFITISVISGFIVYADAAIKLSSPSAKMKSAHSYGMYASIAGWVAVGIMIAIFALYAYMKRIPGKAVSASIVLVLIVVLMMCSVFALMAARNLGGSDEYIATPTKYSKYKNFFIYSGVAGIVCCAFILFYGIYLIAKPSPQQSMPVIHSVQRPVIIPSTSAVKSQFPAPQQPPTSIGGVVPPTNVKETPLANVKETPLANVKETPLANVKETPLATVKEVTPLATVKEVPTSVPLSSISSLFGSD